MDLCFFALWLSFWYSLLSCSTLIRSAVLVASRLRFLSAAGLFVRPLRIRIAIFVCSAQFVCVLACCVARFLTVCLRCDFCAPSSDLFPVVCVLCPILVRMVSCDGRCALAHVLSGFLVLRAVLSASCIKKKEPGSCQCGLRPPLYSRAPYGPICANFEPGIMPEPECVPTAYPHTSTGKERAPKNVTRYPGIKLGGPLPNGQGHPRKYPVTF